jgi:hypothetical protein
VVSDVEQCLAECVADGLARNHQVGDAQDREYRDQEDQLVRVAPGKAGDEAKSAGHDADRKEI